MKRLFILSLMLILVISCVHNSLAQGMGVIKGTSLDADTKKPVSNVLVQFKISGYDDQFNTASISDKNGKFKSGLIPCNKIVNVWFEKKGYMLLVKQIVLLKEGDEKNITVTLKQGTSYSTVKYDTKIFHVKNRDVREIYKIIEPFLSDASGQDRASISTKLQTITVYANQEKLAKIEKAIEQYNIPLKQIWLQVLFVKATGNSSKKPSVPAEIKELASQLESIFKFSRYEIIGRTNAIGMEGSTIQSSVNMNERNSQPSFRISGKLDVKGKMIQLNTFKVDVVSPIQSSVFTTVNIPNGGKIILGTSKGRAVDGSLITVVSAKIIK